MGEVSRPEFSGTVTIKPENSNPNFISYRHNFPYLSSLSKHIESIEDYQNKPQEHMIILLQTYCLLIFLNF